MKILIGLMLILSAACYSGERDIVYLDGKAVYADTLNRQDVKPQEVSKEDLKERPRKVVSFQVLKVAG